MFLKSLGLSQAGAIPPHILSFWSSASFRMRAHLKVEYLSLKDSYA